MAAAARSRREKEMMTEAEAIEPSSEPLTEPPVLTADDAPEPVSVDDGFSTDKTFDDFKVCEEVRQAIRDLGYERPTIVQAEVIEASLAAKDLVVQSKTGSGKTSAFGIPVVERIEAGAAEPHLPHALILAPTRELASQVAKELTALGEQKGLKIHAIYGGVSIGRQAKALEEGVDIVVGTPGRLLDHIRRKNLSMDGIRMIVLDEADEMLSMGFWDDVTDLIQKAPETRQTMLFSATLPYQIAKAAAQYLKDAERIDVSGDKLSVDEIDNTYIMVGADIPKPRQLLNILEQEHPESAIVFCNTRSETEVIAKFLCQSGFVAEALAGNLRQKDRERVMERIKNRELRYMVATDIASRGIDISHLSHVFNYSLPEFPEVYLHRVGRTGRIGRSGVAVSLVDGKGLSTLNKLQREFGVTINEKPQPDEVEAQAARSKRIMQELSEKASVAEVGQHVPTAKEILGAEDGEQVIAFLLKSYFNAQAQTAVQPKRERAERGERGEKGRGRRGRGRGRGRDRDAEGAEGEEMAAQPSTEEDGQAEGEGRRRRRRRRGRRRRGGEGMETMDAAEALGISASADEQPAARSEEATQAHAQTQAAEDAPLPEAEEGFSHIRVNIGFNDGFKGRGAVAKKISSLAGLNDGIIKEVESKRDHAVLKATADIAEILVERVDGAQIGKKILTVAVT
jgi:ATP-dependent RNA helicase DeaD